MSDKYRFDPPKDITLNEVTELFRHILIDVDEAAYLRAPEKVRKLFKLSIFSESPSKRFN